MLDFGTWLQGILFILTVYHISAYIFTKDKSFGLYAIYLFLVLVYLIPKTPNHFKENLLSNHREFFNAINWIIQIWYWIIYALFSLYFLSIESKNSLLYNKIIRYLIYTAFISTLFFLIDFVYYNNTYISFYFIFFFTPISLLFISVFFYIIYKYKDPINSFYAVGLGSFILFSIISLYFSYNNPNTFLTPHIKPISFFKIGVLIEATVLSIGLGYKYHIYRKEKESFNQQLIVQLQKNEKLKDLLNEQLSEQVEMFQIEQLETAYKNEINELKLSSLLSQMNPHFIFNALNSIKLFVIDNDKTKSTLYLNKFSKLIRKILDAPKVKKVSLADEIASMKLYMSLENIRFSNQIDFDVQVANNVDLYSIKIPSLVLQPFIENAIWYGLSSKKNNKKIRMSISRKEKNSLIISIEDNGIGREKAIKINAKKSINREHNGLHLSKERLQNFYKGFKNKYLLVYTDLIDNKGKVIGTKVSLQLPLI